jgi:MFS family permease
MSYADSLNLLLVLNGMGIPGRLIPNHLADRYGPITVFIPTTMIAGACILSWMAVKSVTGLYVWAVFYGMAAGGIQSLFPAGLSSLTPDLRKAGIRLGMAFSINSFATLVGPPIAGAIITASGGSYHGAQVFAGVLMLVGTGFFVAAKMARIRRVKGSWRTKV